MCDNIYIKIGLAKEEAICYWVVVQSSEEKNGNQRVSLSYNLHTTMFWVLPPSFHGLDG